MSEGKKVPAIYCSKEATIAKLEEKVATLEGRVGEHSAMLTTVHELVTEIKVMNINIKSISSQQARQCETLSTIDSRLDKLEHEPGRQAKEMRDIARKQVVTGVASAIVATSIAIMWWLIKSGAPIK